MSINKLNAYLMFNGDAGQAIRHYERALGARAEFVQRFGEVPGGQTRPEDADRIIHALLRIGEDAVMLSDSRADDPVQPGASVQVCLDFSDAGEMAERFRALADGGKVTLPLHDTFWGATFGMLTDPFGIHWMFNCSKQPAAGGGA